MLIVMRFSTMSSVVFKHEAFQNCWYLFLNCLTAVAADSASDHDTLKVVTETLGMSNNRGSDIRHAREDTVNPIEKHQPLPFAHTLNGTAAAIPRLIVALLENGVQLDDDTGKALGLNLPVALRPFWLGSPGPSRLSISWV